MTTPATPSSKQPADSNVVVVDDQGNAVTAPFDYRLQQFWKNNGKLVLVACVVVLLAILARGGWELYAAQQEKSIEDDYAAANSTDKLKAFASAHAGHSLAGVAYLRIADEDYAASRFPDALASYEKSAAILKTGPLAARSQLGAAMSKLGAGKAADGEAALKQLSGDTSQLKSVRAEATYQLASLAAEAGRADEVVKDSDLLMQIDANSSWAQRAMSLRASLPVVPAAATVPAVKTDGPAPGVQVKLPAKP